MGKREPFDAESLILAKNKWKHERQERLADVSAPSHADANCDSTRQSSFKSKVQGTKSTYTVADSGVCSLSNIFCNALPPTPFEEEENTHVENNSSFDDQTTTLYNDDQTIESTLQTYDASTDPRLLYFASDTPRFRLQDANGRYRVGIILYDQVDVLDYAGPLEVFSVTRLDRETDGAKQTKNPFQVLLVSETMHVVTTSGGMQVLPQLSFDACPQLDILIVPGGWGARRERYNLNMIHFIRKQQETVKVVASVCTGALILGQAGLLEGKKATTHWQSLDLLSSEFGNVLVKRRQHWTQDGTLFTSAGISAGIDMSLKIVHAIFGERIARRTAMYMEYPLDETNKRRIPMSVDGRAIEVPDERMSTGSSTSGSQTTSGCCIM
jgi:putative intracellular protease/amidase